MRIRIVGVVLSLVLVTGSAASAQRRGPSRFQTVAADVRAPTPTALMALQSGSSSPNHGLMILAGIGAAAGGLVGGVLAGEKIERRFHDCACDDPGLYGAILGAAAGPALLTPIAVHVASGGTGSLTTSYARAAAIGAAGFVSLFAFGAPGLVVLAVGAPIAQVYSAVRAETAP